MARKDVDIFIYLYLLLERYASERQGYSIDRVESEWKIYYYVYNYHFVLNSTYLL